MCRAAFVLGPGEENICQAPSTAPSKEIGSDLGAQEASFVPAAGKAVLPHRHKLWDSGELQVVKQEGFCCSPPPEQPGCLCRAALVWTSTFALVTI